MANILDQYGIKEVADVTLYAKNNDGTRGAPVLYLDTLKVSTIEQTAEQSEAKGGKGNSPLIIWDFGKEITVNLEDALFTPKSMHIMFGDSTSTLTNVASATITKMRYVSAEEAATYSVPAGATVSYFSSVDMSAVETAPTSSAFYAEEKLIATASYTIEVSANSFPGTYELVGDTYARNKQSGIDEFFQFIIPQAKMSAENTITLEAEGDPTVFNMQMRVLRPRDGIMMKLVKYTLQ